MDGERNKDTLLIVGLGGSMGQNSTSLSALKIALEGSAEVGARN